MLSACENSIDLSTGNEEAPACQIQGQTLDFGRVTADGTFAERVFSIRNIGGGSLTGSIQLDSEAFSITEGSGRFTLGPGQLRRVTVRFQPKAGGSFSESVILGFRCRAVELTGTADAALMCRVDPVALDFGSVATGGAFQDRTFRIVNTGLVPLSGTVAIPCDAYTLRGAAGYTIPPGDSLSFTVRFQPASAGNQDCLIDTGLGACPDVACSGLALNAPECDVSPAALAFGTLCAGATADRSVTITNTGTTPFSGQVGFNGAGYSIVSGGGAFTLGFGESRAVTVRFAPTGAGSFPGTLSFGAAACAAVPLSGTGLASAPCTITPGTLAFGTIDSGTSSVLSYRLDNPGCAAISGEVQAGCGPFTVISGSGPFTIEPGGFRTVTVRFEPTAAGTFDCTIGNGGGCPDARMTGTASEPPVCSVTPAQVEFGPVLVGSTVDRSFTIRNLGAGTLTGSVTESCPEVSIIAGAGAFSLGAGAQRLVTLRFAPTAVGPVNCTVDLGANCAPVTATGTGDSPPVCSVTPTFLNFGPVTINTGAERTFTVRNTGGGTLSGNITESCPDYSLVSGGGAFSLGPGESKVVTVRFQPAVFGTLNCGIGLGLAGCTSVTCTGSGQQATNCQVVPTLLDFGTVTTGTFAERTFNITNSGGGTISGSVALGNCPGYTLESGGGAYSLSGGQTRTVRVRYTATVPGTFGCTIDTGTNDCLDVTASADAQNPPACTIAPASLQFDPVTVGTFAEKSFTITNTGGGTLSGTMTENCPDFLLSSGGGAYSLAAGQSRTVVVRFAPVSTGSKNCSVATGNDLCPTVAAAGTAEAAPFCSISPPALTFGLVPVGQTADQSFTITNTGGGVVTGSISELCDAFSIVSGGGAYSLGAGQSKSVTIRFSPTTGGSQSCLVETGSATCANVSASGTGDPPPVCQVSPASLAFGTVSIGTFLDRSFTITNTGGQTLSGSVGESCAEFTLQQGAGSYTLGAGQTRTVTVRYQPTTTGAKTCTITTGSAACANVGATGTGEPGPVCQLSTASLNYGIVAVGLSSDRSFTITNSGGGTLTGTVSESCTGYSIIAGGGAYALGAGQSRNVTVRFTPPDFQDHACTITLGGICANVSANGTGGVSHARHVTPLVQSNCALAGCHNGSNALPDFRVHATMSSPTYVNTGNPTASLIFQKASVNPGISHSGGKPWPVGGASYNLVLKWVQQGALNLP